MKKIFEALLHEFDVLHSTAREAVDTLPSEALDWIPGPDMNSLTVLIVHLLGSERYWIGDVVVGDPSFRDRESEFRVKALGAEALRQRLAALDTYEGAAFEMMDPAELEEERTSPRDGRKETVAAALTHALRHTATHVGHIEILAQMWKQQHAATG